MEEGATSPGIQSLEAERGKEMESSFRVCYDNLLQQQQEISTMLPKPLISLNFYINTLDRSGKLAHTHGGNLGE